MAKRRELILALTLATTLVPAATSWSRGLGIVSPDQPYPVPDVGATWRPTYYGSGFSYGWYMNRQVITGAYRGEFEGASNKGGSRGAVPGRSFNPDGTAGAGVAGGGFLTVGPVTYGGAAVGGPRVIGGGARLSPGGFTGSAAGNPGATPPGGFPADALLAGSARQLRGGRGFPGGPQPPPGGLPSDNAMGALLANRGASEAPSPAGGLPVAHALYPISTTKVRENANSLRRSFQDYDLYTTDWFQANPDAVKIAVGSAWNHANWEAVRRWLEFGSTAPALLDYGVNVVYDGQNVKFLGSDAGTLERYYQRALAIAETADGTTPSSGQQQLASDEAAGDWLPLGVFAMSKRDEPDANVVFQLALQQSGVIRGNSTSTSTRNTLPVRGAVDKSSQRVAWTVGRNKTIIFETGIYNLTRDEAPALLLLGKDRAESWILVRLRTDSE